MNGKDYTAQNLGEHMVLAEYHIADYLRETGGIPDKHINEESAKQQSDRKNDMAFCIECLTKHALAISGFAKEGTRFFNADPYFSEVNEMATALYKVTPSFNRDYALKFYDDMIFLRKNLVAKHLILGDIITKEQVNHLTSGHIKG